MTILDIEKRYGLPARIRIPVFCTGIDSSGRFFTQTEYLYRVITKKVEEGHYSQYNESTSNTEEFRCCYEKEVAEIFYNNWEYVGKPEEKTENTGE